MVISLSAIRLRKLWYYFILTYNAFFIVLQIRKSKGFIRMKNTGFGYWHYTLSIWESEADVKAFSHSGTHLKAIKKSHSIATDVSVYTYSADKIPTWKEAKELVIAKGKAIKYT